MKPQYQISIRQSDTIFWSVDQGGGVVSNATPSYLQKPPAYWDKTDVNDKRNTRYFSLDRMYSTSYQFVAEGAKILRHIKYTLKRKAKAKIYVELLNPSTLTYSLLFKADLNFAESQDIVTDTQNYFLIEILEDSVPAFIRSRENTSYDLFINGPNTITVEMPAFKVKGKVQFMSSWPIPIQGDDLNSVEVGFGRYPYFIYLDKTTVRGEGFKEPIILGNDLVDIDNGAAVGNVGTMGQLDAAVPAGLGVIYSSPHLFKADVSLYNVKAKGKLGLFLQNNSTGSISNDFKLMLIRQTPSASTVVQQQIITLAPGANTNVTFNINSAATTMTANEILKIVVTKITVAGAGQNQLFRIAWENKNDLEITFEHYTEKFTFKALKYFHAFDKMTRKITDNTATATSSLLTTTVPYSTYADLKPNCLAVASTSSICGIVKPDPENNNNTAPVITTTFSDMFKDLDSLLCVGIRPTANTIGLERKATYINPTVVIAEITDPDSFEIVPAKDFLFNTMKIGSKNQNYDGLNGLKEYNITQQWQFCKNFPITDVIKELDLVGAYRYDMFGIYYTYLNNMLLNQDGSYNSGSNSASNNDTFVIEINETPDPVTGYYKAKTWNSNFISNVDDPANSINLGTTPARRRMRHKQFIYSTLWGIENDYIKYVRSDKNSTLTSNLQNGVGIVDEDAEPEVSAAAMGPALFIPEFIKIKVKSQDNYLAAIAANPDGVFKVFWKGVWYAGFPWNTGVKTSVPEPTYQFTLLSSPLNNYQNNIQ